MALVKLVDFFQDDEGHWAARLSCGHTQHVRHHPPLESRPWVTTAEGRAQKVGAELDCPFCDMALLPAEVRIYKVTREFTKETVPAGMTREHATKPAVWGKIVVREGHVTYHVPSVDRSWVLRPGVDGIIVPEQVHRIQPSSGARFHIEFLH